MQLQSDAITLDEIVTIWLERDLLDASMRVDRRALSGNIVDRFDIHFERVPLRVLLHVFLQRFDLVCDYRFDQLVVTTGKDALTWRDRTGVMDLRPPPGSAWAKALDAKNGC